MSGIDSDVSGIFSAMASMKTEKASKTVIPRPIFSPESGGKQNTRTVRVLIIMHGNTMLYLEKDKINDVFTTSPSQSVEDVIIEIISCFVVLVCHSAELDGFDKYFQATVHFPLTSVID